MRTLEIIPAIDIFDKQCVRLRQGDIRHKTVYPKTPLEYAKQWQAKGATRLYVVDLNAAKGVGHYNLDVVEEIVRSVDIPVEFGGGIRSKEAIEHCWKKLGINRLKLGTAAIADIELVAWAASALGDGLVVAIDAKDDTVHIKGWGEESSTSIEELMLKLASLGVARIDYTDILADGMLNGPNFYRIMKVVKYAQSLTNPMQVGVGGGTRSLSHIVRVRYLEADKLILGKTLYEEDGIDLGEALTAVA